MSVHPVFVMVSAESSKRITPGKASRMASQLGTFPMRFGNKIHLVWGVTTALNCSKLGTYVLRPTSQNTGLRPSCTRGATVVENPHAGVTTSLRLGRSRAQRPKRIALLPEFTKSPYLFPNTSATLFSNSTERSPKPASQPSRRQASTALISSSPYDSNLLGAYHTFLGICLKSTAIFKSYESVYPWCWWFYR